MNDSLLLLYCLDPLDRKRPDSLYVGEASAGEEVGLPWGLVDHDAIVRGEAEQAVSCVPVSLVTRPALYRGWMMTVDRYEAFYQALAARGVRLVNDPAAYRHCHHLPESYSVLEGHTPRTVWLPVDDPVDLDRIMESLRAFGDVPLVLKDYVKSQKHAWHEACFIPSATDRPAVERVVWRFLELQGPELAGGLVFREFIEFEPIGQHPGSGMPLTLEYRLFFFDGKLLLCAKYWDARGYSGERPPLDRFTARAARVRSRFFTMDVARRRDGEWMVVELGDGQGAGLPEQVDVTAFYRELARCEIQGEVQTHQDTRRPCP